ncbi:SOS response-associated peptidase family protein [Rhizobium terrae]|uniref:SOS response-associated peptidase family protein n=1 Tax=Rhizobium terrae TaxID=2171756 RepID=UPI000E3CA0E0
MCSQVSRRRCAMAVSAPLSPNWCACRWSLPAACSSESYAILTTTANDDVAPFHERQMAVLRREQRMAWLDLTRAEAEILQPLPPGSFRVSSHSDGRVQAAFAF